ncbi:hypothetical protein B9Z55_025767 [Caenorhabditis nigoni]|uniref:Uncharacterized protein n=1 Tax=Caenorhabditis nigoni TaxID=1611254 RepID=A0A2G5T094_9PELO|nr:hypothetical protein B9Z55_025767 [Caenorhabditis nigoni]
MNFLEKSSIQLHSGITTLRYPASARCLAKHMFFTPQNLPYQFQLIPLRSFVSFTQKCHSMCYPHLIVWQFAKYRSRFSG